jgi:hypothetical protein
MVKLVLNNQNMVFLIVLLAVRDDKEGQEIKHKKVQPSISFQNVLQGNLALTSVGNCYMYSGTHTEKIKFQAQFDSLLKGLQIC